MALPSSERARALLALGCVQLLFGIQYVAAKRVLEVIPPKPWALIRAGTAGFLLLAIVLARRLPFPPGSDLVKLAGLALLGVAINQYLFVEGLHRTTPAHSALINCMIPVLVLLMAAALGRERVTLRRVGGIATTFLGILVLIGVEKLDLHAATVVGDALTFMNAFSYSWFLVLGKPVMERQRAFVATALLLAMGGAWLTLVGGRGLVALPWGEIPGRIWLLGAVIVLGPTIGAYGLNTYALARVDSSVVALFVYVQPVIAAVLSIATGYETPSFRLFASAAIVFLGMSVALRPRPAIGSA
ncbi:MAG: DMT family transporter [Acidobacteriota bacterium]